MPNENINVDTGIGKVENQYGDVHFHGVENTGFKVRKDFQSIEEDIYRLYEYGKVFHKIRDDFTHYKNREDFNKIYNLPKEQREVFERLYSIGGDSSFALYSILENLNELRFYPTLSRIIDDLEKSLHWEEKINSILKQSQYQLKNLDIDIYAVEGMNNLHQDERELLTEIERIVKQLKQSDLYQKENNLDKTKISTDDAPALVKTLFWFFNFIKKHPIIGVFILIFFIGFLNKDWIYTQNKHFIDTKILKKQIGQKQKNELDNIQSTAIELQKYWNEIRDKEMHFSSYGPLTKSLSALGFSSEQYLSMDDSNKNDLDKLQNYNLLRAKFKGYIENKYPKYKYFFEAMNNLAVLIYASPSQDYAEFFNENWKKFEDSYDYVVPHFYVDSSKGNKFIQQKAQTIYVELLSLLRKG